MSKRWEFLTVDIPMLLPDLNMIVKAAGAQHQDRYGRRTMGSSYSDLKKANQANVAMLIKQSLTKSGYRGGCLPHPLRGRFRFDWREHSKRRDPDNFIGGGSKVILDAMRMIGLIKSDGWALYEENGDTVPIMHSFRVNKRNPGVCVTIVYPTSEEASNDEGAARCPDTEEAARLQHGEALSAGDGQGGQEIHQPNPARSNGQEGSRQNQQGDSVAQLEEEKAKGVRAGIYTGKNRGAAKARQ